MLMVELPRRDRKVTEGLQQFELLQEARAATADGVAPLRWRLRLAVLRVRPRFWTDRGLEHPRACS